MEIRADVKRKAEDLAGMFERYAEIIQPGSQMDRRRGEMEDQQEIIEALDKLSAERRGRLSSIRARAELTIDGDIEDIAAARAQIPVVTDMLDKISAEREITVRRYTGAVESMHRDLTELAETLRVLQEAEDLRGQIVGMLPEYGRLIAENSPEANRVRQRLDQLKEELSRVSGYDRRREKWLLEVFGYEFPKSDLPEQINVL